MIFHPLATLREIDCRVALVVVGGRSVGDILELLHDCSEVGSTHLPVPARGAGHRSRYDCGASPGNRATTSGGPLAETVRWYREREDWWRPLKSGEYTDYYRRQYGAPDWPLEAPPSTDDTTGRGDRCSRPARPPVATFEASGDEVMCISRPELDLERPGAAGHARSASDDSHGRGATGAYARELIRTGAARLMRAIPTPLQGPILLEPMVHRDERGFFLET